MKIPAPHGECGGVRRRWREFRRGETAEPSGKIDETLGNDMDHEALALKAADAEEQRRPHHLRAEALEGVGSDDEVGDARLVLERREDHAVGATGALTHQHEARDADERVRT